MNNYFKSVIIALIMVFCLGLTAAAVTYNEAPDLAQEVEEGTLPPVNERLPLEPLVVDVDEIGVYGGDIYMPTNTEFTTQIYASESLVLFDKGSVEMVPGLAKEWEINEDATEYTFYLREGLKWSDGEPFTTDDLMFWWEDIMNNEDLSPAGPPSWMKPGDETEVVQIDSHTIKYKFDEPFSLFLNHIAFDWINTTIPAKHYLKQFHADYVDEDELAEMVEEGGFETWDQLFGQKSGNANSLNVDHPTLGAWKVVQTLPETRMILVRNPYYYKVDPEGNQLPYIDRFISEKITDPEVVQMKILDGQVDLTYRMTGFDRYTMLKQREEEGGYRIDRWTMGAGWTALWPNYHVKNEAKREIFNNVKFRKAISYAVDRGEIDDIFTYGMGEYYNPVANKESPYYVEGTGYTATEYDPEKANQLLDEIGLDERDEEGFRLLPNGEKFNITITCYEAEGGGAPPIEVANMIADKYWKDIGLRTRPKLISRDLWYTQMSTLEYDMFLYGIAGIGWDYCAYWYVPYRENNPYWGQEWGNWYVSGGEEGVEPPEEIKKLQNLYEELVKTVDYEKRLEIGGEILKTHDENLWVIGYNKVPFAPTIVNERLRNVVENGIASYRANLERNTWPEQLFFVDGKRK